MAPATGTGTSISQQARFTALDGTVRVKKGNSNSWVTADYNIPLEKGDVVQTGSEGMAKVVFNDGTSYTVKQDSLIVIEENSSNDQQQTNVAVAVSTGTVDLSTATYSQGSKSQVIVAGATASLAPESAAQVHNDPKADQHEILMKKGSGEVTRNGETVQAGQLGKSQFSGTAIASGEGQRDRPAHSDCSRQHGSAFFHRSIDERCRILLDADGECSWLPPAHLPQPIFFLYTGGQKNKLLQHVTVTNLGEGPYYWMVQSYDSTGKESVESEKNRFTIIPKGKDTEAIELGTRSFHPAWPRDRSNRQDANWGARNGERQRSTDDRADGGFHYFTPPLPAGETVITVTAQTAQGGVNTAAEEDSDPVDRVASSETIGVSARAALQGRVKRKRKGGLAPQSDNNFQMQAGCWAIP